MQKDRLYFVNESSGVACGDAAMHVTQGFQPQNYIACCKVITTLAVIKLAVRIEFFC